MSSRRAPSSSSAASVRSSPAGTVTSDRGRGRDQRRHEGPLGRRQDRHVEQHDGQPRRSAPRSPPPPPRRQLEQRRAIGQAARPQRVLEARQQLADVLRGRAAAPELGERPGRHAREPQLGEGRGERAREARESRHRREVAERARPERLERDARGERLRPEPARGRRAEPRQLGRRQPRGQLDEARAVEAEGRARRHRHAPHEVVGGLARGPDHQRLGRGGQRREEGAGGLDPLRGRRRHDRADHGHSPRGPTVDGYTACAPIRPDRDRPVNDSIV